MNIDMQILDKPKKNFEDDIKVKSTSDIMKIKDVQAIRNAIREHLLFIGLDSVNNVRNISVLGIGTTCNVIIDTKEIIRAALFSASERVVLVHNHPSNDLKPSEADLHLTNVTNQILKAFNIRLLDHIIVTEKEFISMNKIKKIDKEYENEEIQLMSKAFLIEENKILKSQIEELEARLNIEDGKKTENSIDEIEM